MNKHVDIGDEFAIVDDTNDEGKYYLVHTTCAGWHNGGAIGMYDHTSKETIYLDEWTCLQCSTRVSTKVKFVFKLWMWNKK